MGAADELRRRIGRVGVWLGALGLVPAAEERGAVLAIEHLRYGALWFGEAPGTKEIFAHAGVVLGDTERLVVASGIAGIYSRDAVAAAAGSNTLAEAFPGRFVLGLGVSHAPAVQTRGHRYEKPVPAMRAYLDAMDAVEYRAAPPPQPVPRMLAALRPRMLELARERAMGAHPYFVSVAHTARARALLGDSPVLAPEQTVLLDRDPARARARARAFMAPYLRLPNYAVNLRELGFGDADLAGGGSDRLVDAIVAWGDEEAIAERVRAHHDAGADHVAIQPLVADVPAAVADLTTLAPVLLGR
ncbi:MAG TPA: TIGR03620 family F420-dependent LLM class oxidoreductase [Solirubrobacteraceae bacterium]|nr:TIGR03620 family F420-dependent LLM class oxidoreductase [Solirubrobacteraceae bacterium]